MERQNFRSQSASSLLEAIEASGCVLDWTYSQICSQFELMHLKYHAEQSMTKNFAIDANYLVIRLNYAGYSLTQQKGDSCMQLLSASSASILLPGEYRLRDGVGHHETVYIIARCPKDTVTRTQVDALSAGDRTIKIVGHPIDMPERGSTDLKNFGYFSVARIFYGVLRQAFEAPSPSDKSVSTTVLGRFVSTVEANLAHDWTSASAAAECGYSVFHFSRTFKEEFRIGFHAYVEFRRTLAAVELLLRGYSNAEYICREVGFSNRAKLYSAMREHLGLCITDFKVLGLAA